MTLLDEAELAALAAARGHAPPSPITPAVKASLHARGLWPSSSTAPSPQARGLYAALDVLAAPVLELFVVRTLHGHPPRALSLVVGEHDFCAVDVRDGRQLVGAAAASDALYCLLSRELRGGRADTFAELLVLEAHFALCVAWWNSHCDAGLTREAAAQLLEVEGSELLLDSAVATGVLIAGLGELKLSPRHAELMRRVATGEVLEVVARPLDAPAQPLSLLTVGPAGKRLCCTRLELDEGDAAFAFAPVTVASLAAFLGPLLGVH